MSKVHKTSNSDSLGRWFPGNSRHRSALVCQMRERCTLCPHKPTLKDEEDMGTNPVPWGGYCGCWTHLLGLLQLWAPQLSCHSCNHGAFIGCCPYIRQATNNQACCGAWYTSCLNGHPGPVVRMLQSGCRPGELTQRALWCWNASSTATYRGFRACRSVRRVWFPRPYHQNWPLLCAVSWTYPTVRRASSDTAEFTFLKLTVLYLQN
jgi:hypothetical protein